LEDQKPRDTGSIKPGHLEGSKVAGVQPFSILDLPRLLFEELSAKLGSGETFETIINARGYDCRRLDPQHPLVGFEGTLSYEPPSGGWVNNALLVWDRKLKPEYKRDEWEPSPIFALRARSLNAGVWAAGSGNLKQTGATIEFPGEPLEIRYPACRLVALITLRAHQLAHDPNCQSQRFWDGFGETP
jgi:hypothetical protein